MQPNYSAWDVDPGNFEKQRTTADKIRFLLNFAVLAPSGHNTQPWNFAITNDTLTLIVNRERSLAGSDPGRRQLLIAFGCMIENLVIAAAHYGLRAEIQYFPKLGNTDIIAVARFAPGAGENGELFPEIVKRRTNRGKYKTTHLPEHFINEIKGLRDGHEIIVITDPIRRNEVADIANEAQIEAMDDPAFREELSHFIRSSYTKEHTGMPGFALEIPGPASLFAARLIKRVNVSRASKRKDDELLKQHTPAFVIIGLKGNDPAEWIKAGRLFERIWLIATQTGLSCSPLAAPIQSEKHNEHLRIVLGTGAIPQVLFRIGFPEQPARHSPRFHPEQLLVNQ